jgi:hypothetical protein
VYLSSKQARDDMATLWSQRLHAIIARVARVARLDDTKMGCANLLSDERSWSASINSV